MWQGLAETERSTFIHEVSTSVRGALQIRQKRIWHDACDGRKLARNHVDDVDDVDGNGRRGKWHENHG